MPPPRYLRLRVLEVLEGVVKQFRTREDIYPLRVPREPIPLEDVIARALPDDHAGFDPIALRSRTLLTLDWEDVRWEAWVIALPSGLKVYCDADAHETRILASGGRNAGEESDRLFLAVLADSGGEEFGIEMSGGAPTRVRSSIDDRAFLVEFFVNLFEVSHAEASVRRQADNADGAETTPMDLELAAAKGSDFSVDVARWLTEVMR